MISMQRSLLIFEESCKSIHTRKQYRYYLDKFIEFYHIQDYDSLLAIEPAQIQIMIEDYVMQIKKQVSPNSVQTMLFGVKSFFEANDIEIRWKKIQKLFPEKVKVTGASAYSKEQIKLILSLATDVRSKALVLFLASSGIRIGALTELQLKHLQSYENCKIITVYSGTRDEYQTFLSPEATKALETYLNKRKENGEVLSESSPVFRTIFNVKYQKAMPAQRATLQEIVRRLLIKTGMRSGHENKRYSIQIDHGFRKFFNYVLKNTDGINLNYAEKLMGHSVSIPLDNHYLEAIPYKLFNEYKKAIPGLTIDQTEYERETRIKTEQEKSELERKNKELLFMMQQNSTNNDAIAGLSDMVISLSREVQNLKNRSTQAKIDHIAN
jgi:integrase/recombinase XerD